MVYRNIKEAVLGLGMCGARYTEYALVFASCLGLYNNLQVNFGFEDRQVYGFCRGRTVCSWGDEFRRC